MRLPLIQFLLFVALLCLSQNVLSERASSAFDSEIHEVEHAEEEFAAPSMDVPKNKDNAETPEFNDFTYTEEEEFLENEINFDENGDIVFHPTGLYYHDCPLSITAAREFEITNSMNNPVTIFTVRSSNRQFHSTLSKNQEIAGGGKLKVNILYLPHQTEFLTADLTIVTSRGEYIMPISANSIKNPYKIDPQLGIRFPASSSTTDTLEKPIIVFNPHQETLHITEVFTTENFLALKGAAFQGVGSDPDAPASDKIKPRTDTEGQRVVSDGTSGSSNATAHTLWSIPPGGEKEIITLTVSKDLPPGLHSGFLHIKTDHANLVMPVELTALNTLVYPPHEELNFGVLPTPGSRNTLDLWINNFGEKNVEVLEIILVNPDPNMRVELVSVPVIYAGTTITSRVAKLHYTAAHAGQVSNKLLVITNNTNAASAVIEIRYRANVMHGGIRFNNENTLFRIEVFNQTYPFECSHCDTHGSRLGFNDDLYSALLDDYYLKQNLLTNANTNANTNTNAHTNTHTTTTHDTQHVHTTNTYSTHTHAHTNHEHPYEDGLAERPDHVITHTLTIQNCFPTAAYIISVAHNCEEFLFTDFTPPTSADVVYNTDRTVVNNYETWRPIRVTLKAALVYALYRESPDFLPKMCHLDVTTNISTHRVPIYVSTGALSIEFMDMPMMEDFGSANVTSLRPTLEPPVGSGAGGSGSGSGDKGDLEVQLSSEGSEQWRCESPLCQSVNGDIFHVDLGNQSIQEPRLLRIVLVNANPFKVPIKFSHASHDACVCTDSSWQASTATNTVEFVEPLLSRARPVTWASALGSERNRCFCLEPSYDEQDSGVDAKLRARQENVVRPRDGLSVTQIQELNPVGYPSEAGHSQVYTIALRNLSTCRVYPTVLRGFSNVAMSECRSDASSILLPDSAKIAPKLKNGDRSSIRIDFYTDHQKLQLHLHFTARVARFRTHIAPPSIDRSQGGLFVLGQGSPLVLRTRSTLSEPLRDFQYFVEPNTVYRIEYESALNNNPLMKTWHTGVYLNKVCMDRTSVPMQDLRQLTLTPPPAEDETLRGMSVYKCSQRILSNAASYSNVSDSGIVSMLRRMDGYMQKVTMIAPKVAFEASLKLKQAWATTFANGVVLPDLAVHMLTPHTSHAYTMQNTTLQLPLHYAPHSYSLRLPTIRVGQVQWFYLNVHNPYDVAVSYTLLEDASSETAKRMKALGGLFFQPLGLEDQLVTSTAVRTNSRYQCTGIEVGTNRRVSNTPIPCECGSADSSKVDDSYCEVDHVTAKHPDEGLLHRTRSLSLVRSAVAYSSTATVLAGLDKLFPESENHLRSQGDTSKPHASELPFLPQSTIESVFVVPPRSNGRIGPLLFAPQVPRDKTYVDVAHSVYMFNNFTGFDRVDIHTSSGAASLTMVVKASCERVNGTKLARIIDGQIGDVICKEGMTERQVSVEKYPPSEIRTHTLSYSGFDQFFHLYVQNTGDVGATLHNVVIDDAACAYPPPAVENKGMWARIKSLFGVAEKKTVSWSMDDFTEMRATCAHLPVTLPANATTGVWVKAPATCEFASQRRTMTLSLDKTPITAATVHEPSNHLTFELDFVMTPEFAEVCRRGSDYRATWPVIKGVCLLALVYAVWQLVAVSMLCKFQREKYVSAKQAKSRRVRTPSKRGPGTPSRPAGASPTAGSPPLSGAGTNNNSAGVKENEPRVVVPENRGVVDLSDILLEEGGGTEGSAVSGGYRRERESLGSEPAGEWSAGTARPKLRAVEALRQARAGAASPQKTKPTLSPVSPVVSPVKPSYMSPLASPQKGPLQGPPSPIGLPPISGMQAHAAQASAVEVVVESQSSAVSKPPGLKPAAVLEKVSVEVEESSVAPPAPLSTSSSEVFESSPPESGATSPSPVLDAPEQVNNSASGGDSAKIEDAISPITPATPAVVTPTVTPVASGTAATTTAPATAPSVTEAKETKDRKSRREREKNKIKETKAAAAAVSAGAAGANTTAAATTPVSTVTEVAPDSARESFTSELSDTVAAPAVAPLSSSVPLSAASTAATTTTESIKAGKSRAEKAAAKKASKVSTAPEDVKPVAVATVPVAAAPAAVPAPAQGAAKTKSKAPKQSVERQNSAEIDSKNTTASAPAPAVSTASKPPLAANRSKISPLRLQQPSNVVESNPGEDSPLFRYSGQLLDPSRDSSAELSALPDYPTPLRAPFPSLGVGAAQLGSMDGGELSGSGKSSLLSHPLPQALWPAGDDRDPVARLGLDLDLELDLDLNSLHDLNHLGQLDLNYAPLASPDNILRATESELRVTADPFFSRTFEPRAKPASSTSHTSHVSHRDRTSSASNYLNDLLNSAPGPFGEDEFSFSGSSRSGKSGGGSGRDWWPSAALSGEALGSGGRPHLQPDSYFDLGPDHLRSGSGRSFNTGSPPGQWSSADLGQSEVRRGPGFSPQHPEELFGASQQRFQPPQRSPHEDLYHNQSPSQPMTYGGGHQGQSDAFYRPGQAGIYKEPQELSRPVFDRTDRGGRESDHARYHPAQQQGPGFEGSLLHPRSPPQPRHKQAPGPGQGQGQGQGVPPQRQQFGYDAHEPMNTHSYDYLDLDRAMEEDAASNSWISELSHPGDYNQGQGQGQGRRLSDPPAAQYGYPPEPVYGGYGRPDAPVPRGAPMPMQHQYQHPQGNPQQQQLRRLEQLRSNRHGAPPGGLQRSPYPPAAPVPAPAPAMVPRYVAPRGAEVQGMGGFADPFSRPEPTFVSSSPGRDPENARWLALNAAAQRPTGDVRMRGQQPPQSQAQTQYQQGPPGMQHMRPAGAAPLAGYAPPANTHSVSGRHAAHASHPSPPYGGHTSQLAQLSQMQARDPRELAALQPFGRDMAAVAEEMNFFNAQSFFGDATGSLVSDVALEALEGEDDAF